MKRYNIAITGYGNLGRTLFNNLSGHHDITVIRSPSQYKRIRSADILFICVPDAKIASVHRALKKIRNVPAFHFSGCLTSDILKAGRGVPLGSIHFPLSFNVKNRMLDLRERFIVFEGNDPGFELASSVFKPFKPKMRRMDRKKKPLYHLACSLSANLPFYYLALSRKHFTELGLPERISEDLFTSALDNFRILGKNGLTGPVIRGDAAVLKKHIDAIEDKGEKRMYRNAVRFFTELLFKKRA